MPIDNAYNYIFFYYLIFNPTLLTYLKHFTIFNYNTETLGTRANGLLIKYFCYSKFFS